MTKRKRQNEWETMPTKIQLKHIDGIYEQWRIEERERGKKKPQNNEKCMHDRLSNEREKEMKQTFHSVHL